MPRGSSQSRDGTYEQWIEETALLGDGYIEETSLLTADFDETTVLSADVEETSLLIEEEDFFKKEVDVIVVHSTTII